MERLGVDVALHAHPGMESAGFPKMNPLSLFQWVLADIREDGLKNSVSQRRIAGGRKPGIPRLYAWPNRTLVLHNAVTNGERDFERRGITDGCPSDYILIQRVGSHDQIFPFCTRAFACDDDVIVRDGSDSGQTQATA